MHPRLFSFVGGTTGEWRVESATAIAGEPLIAVECVACIPSLVEGIPPGAGWTIRGVTSNARYTNLEEKKLLVARQAQLGRPCSTRAALIPIRKSVTWWDLTQDERRSIFEERSRHIEVGLRGLPAIARRLHHCRDLAEPEPFDFLTFFDYLQEDEPVFERMLDTMRASEEWRYVDREVDIRLIRNPSAERASASPLYDQSR